MSNKSSTINFKLQGNNRAYGELTCPNAMDADQGAYSCEAINSKGSCFAGSPGCGQPGQDAILIIRKEEGVCQAPTFNAEARTPSECIPCFCFGITNECSSTELVMSKVFYRSLQINQFYCLFFYG